MFGLHNSKSTFVQKFNFSFSSMIIKCGKTQHDKMCSRFEYFSKWKISTIQFKPITFDLELLKYVFNDDHKYGSMWRAKYLMVN